VEARNGKESENKGIHQLENVTMNKALHLAKKTQLIP
jgi:hypothetical protein